MGLKEDLENAVAALNHAIENCECGGRGTLTWSQAEGGGVQRPCEEGCQVYREAAAALKAVLED